MLIKRNNKGYIIVEAALFLPVFLFAAVLLIFIMRMLHYEEIVHFEAAGLLAETSWQSQVTGSGITEGVYGLRLNAAVNEKIERAIAVSALASDEDEIITVKLSYPITMNLPFGIYDDFSVSECLVSRKWSGADNSGEILGFDAMERSDSENFVFVFTKYGERYHEGGCYYLIRDFNSTIECVSLGEAMSRGYTRCKVCH